MSPQFPLLFSAITIGPRRVKNRICCSAHAECLADDGMPTERMRRYYELKARGGVGLIMCFGSASVHATSPGRDWNGVELFEDRVIPYLQVFSDTMHDYDAPCVAQITHRGRRGRSAATWERLYSASAIREPSHRETPHPVDDQNIDELVSAFADAAERLQKGGFDGCEVMASHGHLIDQFWSPNSNVRDDNYGGSLENRLRFGVDVLEAVRERVGRSFIIGIRMTGDDFIDNGLENALCQDIAGRLDELKIIDYFNIIGSTAETYSGEAKAIPNMSFPQAVYCPLAASIRQVVKAPVIAVGRINHPEVAERVLREGQADLCVMNRSLIADPDLPNKAREGRLDDIRQCRGYNQGCIDRIYNGLGVTCVQNAVIGREKEWFDLPKSDTPKKIVVVGGGPAGLECARIARLRAHEVILFEKNDEPGGQTLIARKAPTRQEFDGAAQYAAQQCRKLGVDMRLGTEATAELVLAESPDVVVIATGAKPFNPSIPGVSESGYDVWQVLNGEKLPGTRILVIDEEYGHQAPSAAEYLLERGKHVDIVTTEATVGSFLGATTLPPVLERLYSKGVRIHNHLRVLEFHSSTVVVENIWSKQQVEMGPYDACVYAFGGEAVCGLEGQLKCKIDRVELIGDCFAPRTLQHAILEGHKLARNI